MNLFTNLTALSAADGLALLAAVALKGTLIFLLAALVAGLMRRASAAARHAVWTLALGAALLLPALFVTLPGWQVPVLDASQDEFVVAPSIMVAPEAPVAPIPEPVAAPHPEVEVHVHSDGDSFAIIERHATGVAAERGELPGVAQRVEGAALSALPPVLHSWQGWLLLVWVVGAAFMMMRWAFAVIGAWRLVQDAEPVEDPAWLELLDRLTFGMDLDREVRLLRSDRLGVPVAGGTFDPVVVLPADADTWPEERREVVLTHELAHILRGDCLTQTLAQWSLALHWFNPLAWRAHRMYLLEREHACDDYVLNWGTRASDYAEHLLQIARRFRRETLALHATAPMARKSNLEDRITSILNPERRRAALSRFALAGAAATALALVLPLAAFQPVEREPDWSDVRFASASVAPAEVLGERLAATIYQFSSDNTFEWEGQVQSGGFVEVQGINGPIRARTGSGDRVRIEAHKTSKHGQEETVEVVAKEFANGVVVCAVYPGQHGECAPGGDLKGNVRNNDVTVEFEVTLPENVRFVGHTVNGEIKTETLGSDVEVHTVNGSIRTASRRGDVDAGTVNGSIEAEAAGLVRAKTVNGSIDARLGRADWSGDMAFKTVNGSITLDLPASLNTTVEARAQTGSIHSDFPLQIRRNGYVGSEADGTIGNGGRHLELDVLNGSIRLQRASGTFGSRMNRDRDYGDEELQSQARLRQARLREAQARVSQVRRDTLRVARLAERQARQALVQAEQMLRNLGPQLSWALDEDEIADLQDDLSEAMDDVRAELASLDVRVDLDVVVDWEEIEEAFEDVEWEMEEAMREVEREMERAAEEMEKGMEEECEEGHEHEYKHDWQPR